MMKQTTTRQTVKGGFFIDMGVVKKPWKILLLSAPVLPV